MVDVVPFAIEHIVALAPRLQSMQRMHAAQCNRQFGEQLAELDHTWTVLHEGRVLACAGVIPIWSGRGHLWAYLSDDAGKHMLAITREVLRKLDEVKLPRYEAEVAEGFVAAHRWVQMLGFHCETPGGMRGFFPDRSTGYLYSKVR